MPEPRSFSTRSPWKATSNRLAQAVKGHRAARKEVLDLTITNPTIVGLDYPTIDLRDALSESSRHPYEPSPLGLEPTRTAVARFLSKANDPVDPMDVVITASTSEAYAFLFKLLCDPREAVLTHVPEYPLLDHLAAHEGVVLRHFPLEFVAGVSRPWTINVDEIRARLEPDVRAVVVISPNNPTGSILHAEDFAAVARVCGDRFALISDEVFADFVLNETPSRAPSASALMNGRVFSLGGLSKSAGLPHWKLGWIRLGGDPGFRASARAALETIADTYLSVSTPIQHAAIRALELAPMIRRGILDRLRSSAGVIRAACGVRGMVESLPVEGGWSAVLRVPAIGSDEDFAIGLLEATGVLVHPGYLYEFDREGFVVLSLLTPEEQMREGISRILDYVGRLS